MSKSQPLTAAEFSRYATNPRTLTYLESYRRRTGLQPAAIRVLDWGCGRGRDVLWLRERGYDAFGVDIDPIPVRNGAELFKEMGHDPKVLSVIDPVGPVPFPDGYFNFTFSNQVFEHVRDLPAIAGEIARITTDGGVGYHIYPAHRHVVEGHLYMPFIHWLPKNRLRRALILLWVFLGRGPGWADPRRDGLAASTDLYYQYSVNKTFYRKPYAVRRIFRDHGFDVRFETITLPSLHRRRWSRILTSGRLTRPLVNELLLTFISVELLLTRSGATRCL